MVNNNIYQPLPGRSQIVDLVVYSALTLKGNYLNLFSLKLLNIQILLLLQLIYTFVIPAQHSTRIGAQQYSSRQHTQFLVFGFHCPHPCTMNSTKSATSSLTDLSDVCVEKCKKFACMIQLCLQKNSEQEKPCKVHIDAWKKCCDEAKQNENKRF